MKRGHYILIALALAAAFLVGWNAGKGAAEMSVGEVSETRETVVDTIAYYMPVAKDSTVVRYRTYLVPIAEARDSNKKICPERYAEAKTPMPEQRRVDSAAVELPIVQRHYADSTYEAWISGPIDPRLDSVRVFAATTIITRREWKPPRRWHIGVTAGYGYGPKGFQPYVGVGITYSVISF